MSAGDQNQPEMGECKPATFEVGVALGAAGAADRRDEPTQREPAKFQCYAVGPGLRTQDRPGALPRPPDCRALPASGSRREDFTALPRRDLWRVALSWAVHRLTSLRQSWIAGRLGLRSVDDVSAQVRKLSKRASEELSPKI